MTCGPSKNDLDLDFDEGAVFSSNARRCRTKKIAQRNVDPLSGFFLGIFVRAAPISCLNFACISNLVHDVHWVILFLRLWFAGKSDLLLS